MATIDNYKIKVDVDGTSQVNALNSSMKAADKTAKELGNTANNTENALDSLGRGADRVAKIAGSAFALIAGSAIKMADSIMDIANATGTTGGFVLGLSQSLQEAGGNFDDAGKILTEFYKSLNELGDLNVKTQDAFIKLGITLEDLRDKTPTELFTKAISALADMENQTQRTALGVQIFGKAFAQIDPRKLEQVLANKDFVGLQVELQKAADLVESLEANFRTLQVAALTVLEPIIGKVNNFRLSAEQAEKVIKLLGATFAIAFGIKTVTMLLEFNKALRETAIVANLLGKNPVLKLLAGGALAVGLGAGIDKMMEATSTPIPGENDIKPAATPSPAGGTESERGAIFKQIQDAQKEIADEQKRINSLTKAQNTIALDYQRTLNGTIGMLDEQAQKVKATADIDKDTRTKIASLEKQIVDEKSKGGFINTQLISQLQSQISLVQQQGEAMKKLKLEELERINANQKIKDELIAQTEVNKLQVDRAYEVLRADEMRKLVSGEITEEQMRNTLDLAKVQTDAAKRLLELQKDYNNATSELERNRILDQMNLERMRVADAIAQKQREVQERNALEQSAAAGVRKAIEDNRKAYTKYNVALESTKSVINNMESAIDQFAETGKLKFSDLARSIIADLTKIALKAALTPVFESIGGKIGSAIGSIFGLATGGPASKDEPYIVGEKGPELFVPKQAGTVIPNNKLESGMNKGVSTGAVQAPITNNYITNNINAVDAKSVAQLFAENRKSLLGSVKMAERELPYMA